MKEITSREDISMLVRTFYGKVQEDDLLGPIFNSVIEDWEEHYERLTDFWQTNLFFEKKYKGNPMQRHVEVDAAHDDSISEMHFGVWLNLWFQTVDELFEGETAQIAKNRARNMGTFIHLKIFEARTKRNLQS
ncbi:group III truncated hemoglobin [Aureisphaera galaxeae]|uniref:group III truncated hemoglobin n=1 Tax=Aureisphaera galaxeae TaxID=1538023 RepID=UPI00234FC974|nr:group III truncated hemoglobin [Aureisphaera galaxeae]MDC8003823.1 group III truncated hemoglobin [Aureisphaera galaxeae]